MAITEVLSMFVVHVIETLGYFGVFIMMTLESACIPFPSEVIMPFAGFVVQEGQLSFLGIVVIGTLSHLLKYVNERWSNPRPEWRIRESNP